MASPLVHLIYVSTASRQFGFDELNTLLDQSRANNEHLDITGVLLYKGGRFFQELEGPNDAIDAIFRKIAQDPRHTGVTKIIHEAIPKRLFSDWKMGFSDLSLDDLSHIVVSKEQNSHASLANLPDGRSRKLLLAFCNGRWSADKIAEIAKSVT